VPFLFIVSGVKHLRNGMNERRILVDLPSQTLRVIDGRAVRFEAPISTARNGPGEVLGSGCTPLGLHRVRLRIGAGCPAGTVFVARRPTGEVFGPELAARFPGRDWILTRILWLTGLEPGRNRGGQVDTLRRFIYIHGCPETEPMGVPCSHGCIRMRSADLIELFDRTPPGTLVKIR
jgi:lipoprotein-anchoring transpeptidase ErfK/SrfK